MITTTFIPEAVVLADGDYPSHPYPLSLLEQSPTVVCCDGAAESYFAHGHRPEAIVGDGDSLSAASKRKFAEKLVIVDEQETNDLSKAMRFLRRHGFQKVAIVGATGKREDHTLGNISLLMEYLNQGFEVRMITDHGVFVPARDTQTFESEQGQQISVFNFDAKHLQSEGLVYPIGDLSAWWKGTLNEAQNASFTIRAEGNYLVYKAYRPL